MNEPSGRGSRLACVPGTPQDPTTPNGQPGIASQPRQPATIMAKAICQSDLEGYLDEALPPDQMARVELALRKDPMLVKQLAAIHSRRNSGVHSLGEIWRRGRLSCPSREQLGSFLLAALPEDAADYIAFHLDVVGCRYCQANLADLESQQAEKPETVQRRRRRYFQSSVGHLRHSR